MSNSIINIGDLFESDERVIKVTRVYDDYFYAKDIAVKKPRLKIRNLQVCYRNAYLSHYGMKKINEKATNKEVI